ncbi:hypothetical protein D2T31_17620 [Sinirhodobacter populi]|uniref:Uncharacterized protein n=1 Tax=Paenirhodobacter populi TaxID=2306993 RepID=A0A443K2W2_9RHOB|nr:hypothetical protein [Sinirhodobacter populi]RWR27100.1 hypothetical protein D2T31_17620 [Sinirhodobacter populi]
MAEPDETPTHQLLVPLPSSVPQAGAIRIFAEDGILLGTCADPAVPGGQALRIGTQFITCHNTDDTPDWDEIARRLAQTSAS